MQVNGEAIETAQRQLSASYGPVKAADCLLALADSCDLECGAFQKLTVQPKNLHHGKLRSAMQKVRMLSLSGLQASALLRSTSRQHDLALPYHFCSAWV